MDVSLFVCSTVSPFRFDCVRVCDVSRCTSIAMGSVGDGVSPVIVGFDLRSVDIPPSNLSLHVEQTISLL